MLKSNKVNLVIALIVAIVLWAYVLGEDNTSNDKMRDVPITFLNEQQLIDSGLIMLNSNCREVNISISGSRTDIRKVRNDEFTVTADLEGLKKGENKIRLKVTAPEDVKVESISTPKITVLIDEYLETQKQVLPEVINQQGDEKEPSIIQVSDETVTVSGAKTQVDKVKCLSAKIDAAKVGEEMKALTVELTPVDKNGVEVSGVKLSKTRVSVTTVMLSKKTVKLKVPVENADHASFQREVSLPRTITIKGSKADLDGISEIWCNTLNLIDVFEDSNIPLSPILPQGIVVASDSENLHAVVTVKGVESKNFDFNESDIVMEGIDENVIASLSETSIVVTVTAKPKVLETISKEDFSLFVDLSDLDEGNHKVNLSCTCNKSIASMEYSPNEVIIKIERSDAE